MTDTPQDPLEFLKSMWSGMGLPMPGMAAPTLDASELEKRIAELKAVEHWLKMNLGMLQMSIQGMEMQRAALAAMQDAGVGAAEAQAAVNPALWPLQFMQQAAAFSEAMAPPAKPADTDVKKK